MAVVFYMLSSSEPSSNKSAEVRAAAEREMLCAFRGELQVGVTHLIWEDAPSPKGSNVPWDNPPRLGYIKAILLHSCYIVYNYSTPNKIE